MESKEYLKQKIGEYYKRAGIVAPPDMDKREFGFGNEKKIDYRDGDVSLLTTEPELSLMRKMLLLPEIVEVVTSTLEPHHLTYYAQDLATVFHSFYKQCRVVSDDEKLTKARLKLVEAAKLVLAKTLHLMGMTAPEKM